MTKHPQGSAPGSHPGAKSNHLRGDATLQTGILRDTVVLTRRGELAVQQITSDDHIVTRGSGLVPVRAVTRHKVLLRAISIAAGSLGDTRPDSDLVLPAVQEILIRDWRAQAMFGQHQAMVQAAALIDGEFIRDQGLQVLELYSIRLDRNYVIYAGGLELASATLPQLEQRPAA